MAETYPLKKVPTSLPQQMEVLSAIFCVESQAIMDEDYDLADEKNRQASNAKSAMARFERRIRDIRKELKKNLAKKHENFSMLRIVHHDTTTGVQESNEKFVKNEDFYNLVSF